MTNEKCPSNEHLANSKARPASEMRAVTEGSGEPNVRSADSGHGSVIPPERVQASPAARGLIEQAPTEAVSAVHPARARRPRAEADKGRPPASALKHGIFANPLLTDGESRQQFATLYHGFRDSLQPQGAVEELLVEKLVVLMWRYRRLLRAERTEIEKAHRAPQEAQWREAAELDNRVQTGQTKEGLLAYPYNPYVLERVIRLLEQLRSGLEERGFLSGPDFTILRRIYGQFVPGEYPDGFPSLRNPPVGMLGIYWLLAAMASQRLSSGECDRKFSPEELKTFALEAIDKELEWRKHEKKIFGDMSRTLQRLETKAAVVLPQAVLDRLLRYEASIERAFDRTLSQLERLQRMRLGQPVASRIQVDVSH